MRELVAHQDGVINKNFFESGVRCGRLAFTVLRLSFFVGRGWEVGEDWSYSSCRG